MASADDNSDAKYSLSYVRQSLCVPLSAINHGSQQLALENWKSLGMSGALIYVYYFHFAKAPTEEMAVNYFFLIMSFWPKMPLKFLSTDFFLAASKQENKREQNKQEITAIMLTLEASAAVFGQK